jgi:S-formylglutathione hydrolase FrmB
MLAAILPASAQRRPIIPQSRVVTDTIHSQVLKADCPYTVYLPKSYSVDTNKKYPILYLLHGMSSTHRDWFDRAQVKDVLDLLIASGEACEMIVVSPNAGGVPNDKVWNGYFDMPGWPYETFFYTELLPQVEAAYRVQSDKEHRAIAGLSMGGGGAASYAQRYPEMYCAAYIMSALMTIQGRTDATPRGADDLMGHLTKSVIDHNCIAYVKEADDARLQQLRTLAWFVDCGDDDFLLDLNLEFFQVMRDRGVPLQLRVRDGGHVWEYWQQALYMCLPFVSRNFAQ